MAATIKAIKAILDQKLKESQLIENQIKGLEEALKDLGGSAVDLPSPAEVATQSTTTTPLCSPSLVIPSHFDWHEYGLGHSCVPHIQCPHSLRHGHVTWPCVPQSHFDWHEHGLGHSVPHIQCSHGLRHRHVTWPCVQQSHFDWHEHGLGHSCVPHIQCLHELRHGCVNWPCVSHGLATRAYVPCIVKFFYVFP